MSEFRKLLSDVVIASGHSLSRTLNDSDSAYLRRRDLRIDRGKTRLKEVTFMLSKFSENDQTKRLTLRSRLEACGLPAGEIDEKLSAFRGAIIALRKYLGVSQKRLAKKCGVGLNLIQSYESGTLDIDERSFDRMCCVLGLGLGLPAPVSIHWGANKDACPDCAAERAMNN